MTTKNRMQIPHVIVDDPRMQAFIDAVVNNYEMDQGVHGIENKRPTVKDMIDAGVTNAEDIE